MTKDNLEKNSSRNIKVGTILGYVALIVNVLYGLLFTPWIVNSIGKSVYGVYTITNTLISMFLVDFGLSTTTNVFLSKYRAKKENDRANTFARAVFKLYLFLDAIILVSFLIAYFLIPYIYKGLSPDEIVLLKNTFLIVASFSLLSFPSSIFTGILQSHEQFIFIKIIDIGTKFFTMLLTVVAIKCGWGIYGIVASHVVSGVTAIVFRITVVIHKTPVRISLFWKNDDKSLYKTIFSFSLFTAISSLGSRLIFVTAPTILGIVSNSDEIAIFGIVSTLESYVFLFSTIISGMFIPKIIRENEKSNNRERLERLAVKVGRIQLFMIGLLCVGFAACGNEFLAVWLKGNDFSVAYVGTLLVMSYQLFFVPQIIYDSAITADQNGVKWQAVFNLVRGATVSALTFLLGWLYGSIGACLSICIVRFLGIPFEWVIYKKFLGVTPKPFYKEVYFRALPALAVSISIGYTLHVYMPMADLYKMLIIGVVVTIIYFVLYVSFLPKQVKARLIGAVKKWRTSMKPIDKETIISCRKIEEKALRIETIVMLAAIMSYFIFLFAYKIHPHLGVCGTYYCYAQINENEIDLIETITVEPTNDCLRTYYFKSGEKLEEPQTVAYKWRMRYAAIEKFNVQNDVKFRTTTVFSFENSSGGSISQVYYSMKENAFYGLQNNYYYGGEQLKYIKGGIE